MENNVYYLQSGTRKPRKMDKAKGHEVSAVGWDNSNKSDLTTGAILLGTQDGHFFGTKISKGKEEFWHLLYTIKDKDNTMAGFKICGMDVQQLGDKRMCILASTPTRLYEFSGGPNFEALFGQLGANPSFQELPGSPNMHSELHLFTARARRERQFAWLTGAGIYTGKMSAGKGSRGKGKADVVKDKDLKPYPCVNCGEDLPQCQCDPADRGTGEPPRSIGLTEFHFMLLYNDQLQVVNQLSSKKVFDEPFRMTRMKGDPRGLLYDPGQGLHWLYTDRFLFRLNIVEEDRNMWELHLDKEQYEEALVFCKNSAQKDAVLTKNMTWRPRSTRRPPCHSRKSRSSSLARTSLRRCACT
jgi:vacuolar protein sorting-associated protein 18